MLERQVVPIGFEGGLDSKTDEKLVLPGRLTLLENGRRKSGKAIIKRNGYNALGTAINGTENSVGVGSALSTFDNELVEFAGNKLYSYSTASDSWIDKGSAYSVRVTGSQVVRNSAQQSVPDMAENQGVLVYAWQDTRGGIRASVIEKETGAQFQSDVLLDATGTVPRVVSVAGFIFVFYIDGTDLKARRINPLVPGTFEAAITLESDVLAASFYDVVVSGLKCVFVYNHAGTIKVGYFTQDGAVGTTAIGLPNVTSFTEDPDSCLSAYCDQSNSEIWIYWHNGTDGLRYMVLYPDLTEKLVATTIDATTTPVVLRATSYSLSATSQELFYEIDATATYDHYVMHRTVSSAGVVGTAYELKRSVGLASKAFMIDGVVYVNTVYDSTLQATYFTVSASGDIVAKMQPGQAGGLPETSILPGVVSISDSKIIFAAQIKTKFISEDNATFTLKGISGISIDFSPENAYLSAVLGDNLHITGGYLSIYDGVSVVEHGFHLFPENVAYTPATSGGSMADGVYLYQCVWEWIDNNGQTHRSAPSVGTQITVSGGSGSGKVTVAVPALRLTAKTGNRTNAVLSVYRTKASQTTAYKVTSISSPTYNDPTTDSISFVDTKNDSTIGANEILYTSGGIVENIAPPACSLIDVYDNRMIVISSEDPLAGWYSKSRYPGEAVSFSDAFVMRADPLGGEISGVKMMDDKIIFAKGSVLFYVAGQGPLDTGAQNNYSEPALITSDVGCANPNSIVLMPRGIMFRSNKGIYLLDRSLQVSYIGADVEGFNGQNITSAEMIENTNEVRFLTDSGVALVYDYYFNQWGTDTNHQGVDAVNWKGVYCYLRNDGKVYKESSNHFLDDNIEYRLRIGTAWLKMAGVQGFQRVRRVALLGNYKSSHVLQMGIGYDYDSTYSDTITFNAGDLLDQNYFGQDAVYGETSVYGGVSDNVYQFRAHLRRQKCEAIRFLFEDVTAGTPGESYSLSDLSLEVGVKRGLMKLKSSKSLG